MVANFAAFAIILSVSDREVKGANQRNFAVPSYCVAGVLALCSVAIVARAAYFQVARADEFLIKDAEVRFADKDSWALRRVQPAIAPKAPSARWCAAMSWTATACLLPAATLTALKKHRDQYQQLGISIDQVGIAQDEKGGTILSGRSSSTWSEMSLDDATSRGRVPRPFQNAQSRVRLQGFDDRRELIELTESTSGETASRVYQYDYTDLIPLVRHRHDPDAPEVKSFLDRQRDVHMSIDAGLQLKASAILKKHLSSQGLKGAIVVLDPATGDLLADVSYPWPETWQFTSFRANPDRSMEADFLDRARFGLYPPGSSFKLVTAVAALRTNPEIAGKTFECKALDGGRVGNYVGNSRRPIRDDTQDRVPHGTVNLEKGIIVSCNAFFAQLGYSLGADALFNTASQFGILVAK